MSETINTKIYGLFAREIINSRATPTIEVTAILQSGYRATVSIPSGMTPGKYDAKELCDEDPARFEGKGMRKAVNNVNTTITQALRGQLGEDQKAIDTIMLNLDGTPDKSKLGVNAILCSSLAIAAAVANAYSVPLYGYLNKLFNSYLPTPLTKIPLPIFNMINGGKHGAGNLNFQEFQIIPASNRTYPHAYQMGVELYKNTRKILAFRNAGHSVGDEGGFTPNLFTNLDAIEILLESIRSSNYKFGIDVFLGLDIAATHFKKENGYLIKDRAVPYSANEFIQYLKDMHAKYHILILEDPLEEDDWNGWQTLTKEMEKDTLIVGDDLLATNKDRLERAIKEKSCSSILLKPNQVGTLSEVLEITSIAKKNDMKTIISHRSGETNDTFVADLAVAVQADYVKFGAPARGERVAKYNRLLEISDEFDRIRSKNKA